MNGSTSWQRWLTTSSTLNLKPHFKTYIMNHSTPWWRWLITLLCGIALWDVGRMLSTLVALVLAGDEAAIFGQFWPMSIYSGIRAMVVVLGLKYVWRIVNGDLASIGFDGLNIKQEALHGTAFGLVLFLLQAVLLPLTGGAQRPDIVASAELMGTSSSGLIAAIMMGWLVGALAEEVFFRGHLIRSLCGLLGGKRWAMITSATVSIALFAIGHSYQGWTGVLGTGLVASAYTALFLWRGRLTAAIAAHGVYNTLAILGIHFLLG